MSGADEKNWRRRVAWAECREPYKTELDTLGSHWIEGDLSNQELAFEAVKLLSELEAVGQLSGSKPPTRVDDVVEQLRVLTEAMLSLSHESAATQADRREALYHMRNLFRRDRGAQR